MKLPIAATSRSCTVRIRCPSLRDIRGVAAVEFALVFPLLLLTLYGMVEMTNIITANRRLQVVANSIAQMLSQSNGSLNYIDVHFAFDSTMILFPLVLADSNAKNIPWNTDISVTASSVVFLLQNPACTSNCVYNAKVAWSGGSNKRPCSVNLSSAPDTATPTPAALPADSFGPGSMIVVDVSYQYTPSVWIGLLPKPVLSKSSYLRPRYVPQTSYIKYSVVGGDDGVASACSGY